LAAEQSASAISRAQPKPRREKMFGEGRLLPLDRNAKARVMVLARALMRRSGEGKHYGVLTASDIRPWAVECRDREFRDLPSVHDRRVQLMESDRNHEIRGARYLASRAAISRPL
jgi:hypothetical protein